MAVGWLCVSTLIAKAFGLTSLAANSRVTASGRKRFAGKPSTTAALSLYALSVSCGDCAWVCLIMRNSDCGCGSPSMVQSALKILWRQCSELACANITSSASLGSRPSAP